MTWRKFVEKAPKCHKCGHPAAFEEYLREWVGSGRCRGLNYRAVPICGMCQGSHCDKHVDRRLHWTPGKLLREWNRGLFDDQIVRVVATLVRDSR